VTDPETQKHSLYGLCLLTWMVCAWLLLFKNPGSAPVDLN